MDLSGGCLPCVPASVCAQALSKLESAMREVLRRRAALHIKERTILLRAFAKVPRVALLQLLHQMQPVVGKCVPKGAMQTCSVNVSPNCSLSVTA